VRNGYGGKSLRAAIQRNVLLRNTRPPPVRPSVTRLFQRVYVSSSTVPRYFSNFRGHALIRNTFTLRPPVTNPEDRTECVPTIYRGHVAAVGPILNSERWAPPHTVRIVTTAATGDSPETYEKTKPPRVSCLYYSVYRLLNISPVPRVFIYFFFRLFTRTTIIIIVISFVLLIYVRTRQ